MKLNLVWTGGWSLAFCVASNLAAPGLFGDSVEIPPAGVAQLNELAKFDLETLLNMQVTSASKKEEKLSHSATAIYVITQEDIRRSGMTTVPELFRMVPGMEVARVNANQWAINSRGFNDPYADKLLVLVDGRTIYTPSFGGVFWADQDLVLEDLQRIEVIRGPGATLWGANAVNGVINVITKKASETQGLMMSGTYGTLEQPSTSIRYGGKFDDTIHYRVYAKYFNHENFHDTSDAAMPDDWRMVNGGVRLDWEPSDASLLTFDAGMFGGDVGEQFRIPSLSPPFDISNVTDNHNTGGHVLGRWTQHISADQDFSLQAYYDKSAHHEFGVEVRQNTFDLEAQHRFKPWDRHEIVWGAGYRYLPNSLSSGPSIHWFDEKSDHQLVNLFVQDEVTLEPDELKFAFGSKFEHNDFTGFEAQPSGRLLYTPVENQSIWASVSRAVRTPTRADTSLIGDFRVLPPSLFTPPVLLRTVGNPDLHSEEIIAYEVGYRAQPTKRVSLDATGFFNTINGLRGFAPGAMSLQGAPPAIYVLQPALTQNLYDGFSYGAEVSAEWAAFDFLRFHASYSWIGFDLSPDNSRARSDPRHEAQIRSYLDLPKDVQLMAAAYYVATITTSDGLNYLKIPEYIRFDVGVTWRPVKSLELGIWGQNLFDPAHAEFTSYQTARIAEIPRSVVGKVTWSW